FLNLYTGAYLTLHAPASVYDLDQQLAVQQGLTGWASPIVPFYLPPHAAVLLSWLALLPYSLAYIVWLLIGVGCVIGSAMVLAPRRPWVWALGSFLFLPALLALVQGQTTALMLLAFAVLCGDVR